MSAVPVWLSLLVTNSARFRFERLPALFRNFERGFRQRLHAHHRYFLEKSPAVPRRLQPVRRKLLPDVVRRNVAAALPRAAPFQLIARKIFHMRPNLFLVNLRQCRLNRGRLLRLRRRAILSRENTAESKQRAQENHGMFLHENSLMTEGIIS